MKKKAVLDFAASQLTAVEFCKKLGVAVPTFYSWKKKFGIVTSNEKQITYKPKRIAPVDQIPILTKVISELERENQLLKNMYADVSIKKHELESSFLNSI